MKSFVSTALFGIHVTSCQRSFSECQVQVPFRCSMGASTSKPVRFLSFDLKAHVGTGYAWQDRFKPLGRPSMYVSTVRPFDADISRRVRSGDEFMSRTTRQRRVHISRLHQ